LGPNKQTNKQTETHIERTTKNKAMLDQGLLEDSHHDREAQDDMFVTNSLLDLSNHEEVRKKDPFADQTRYIPRVSNMSEGDHHEYNGLYSDGGMLGHWKPPPDPRIAAAKKKKQQRIYCGACVLFFLVGIALVATLYVPVMTQQIINKSKFGKNQFFFYSLYLDLLSCHFLK
jgi:hypothetical protein